MRKFASVGLIVALAAAGVPCGVVAASQAAVAQAAAVQPQTGAIAGTARGSNGGPLPNATIRLRNVDTGAIVGTTTTDESGAFAFSGLPAGTCVVEVVDHAGKVLGVGVPLSLVGGAVAATSVVAAASGAMAAAAAAAAASTGGFSIFGLGTAGSVAVLGAASAAAVTAVVTTRPDASPSR